MTGAAGERRLSIRGLPEWLIRDYLTDLGAQPDADEPAAARMRAARWSVAWSTRRAAIPGSAGLGLTQFDIVFAGDPEATADAERRFMAKAQRGGG